MIARIWRGAVRAQDADAYAAYVQRTGIEGYQRTPGNRGAWLLWRVEGERAEFITLSFWESRTAIEGFAGLDIDQAVFYPDDDQFLIERDLTVRHYEVADSDQVDTSRLSSAPTRVPRVPRQPQQCEIDHQCGSSELFSGRIRACGSIWWVVVHQILPEPGSSHDPGVSGGSGGL